MNLTVHLGLFVSLACAGEPAGAQHANVVEHAENVAGKCDTSSCPSASAEVVCRECHEPPKRLLPRLLKSRTCACDENPSLNLSVQPCAEGTRKPALLDRLLSKTRSKKTSAACVSDHCVPVVMHGAGESRVVRAHKGTAIEDRLDEPTRVVPIEVNIPTARETASNTSEIEPRHADDYRWIQGRLHWVHVNGGAWVVRYAPLDEVDAYGGSVVLTRNDRLKDHREGDFVRIEGEILSDRSSVFLGGPLYRVERITLLKSADTHLR